MTMPNAAMTDGDITIEHDNPFSEWSEPQPSMGDFFSDEGPQATADALNSEREPDPTFVTPPPRSRKSRDYETKVKGVTRFAIKALITNPATVADGATLLMYGPEFCEAAGTLAAENIWAAKAIDFLTEGTENAALAFVAATLPIALQVMRNHEPTAEAQTVREMKIPFTRRTLKMRFKVQLPWRARAFTEDPGEFTVKVLTAPGVAEALEKQGIRIVSH